MHLLRSQQSNGTSATGSPRSTMALAWKLPQFFLVLAFAIGLLAVGLLADPRDNSSPLSLITPDSAAACGITGSGSGFDAAIERHMGTSAGVSNTPGFSNTNVRVWVKIATPGNPGYQPGPANVQWCSTYKYNAFGRTSTSVYWTYMGGTTAATSACDFLAASRSSHRGYFFRATSTNCALNPAIMAYSPSAMGYVQGYNSGWFRIASCPNYAAPYSNYGNYSQPHSTCSGPLVPTTGFNPFDGSDRVFYDTVVPPAPTVVSNAGSLTYAHPAGNTSATNPLAWIRPGGGAIITTATSTDTATTTTTSSGYMNHTWLALSSTTGWSGELTPVDTTKATRSLTAASNAVTMNYDVRTRDKARNNGTHRKVYLSIDGTKPAISFGTMTPALGTAIDPTYRGSTSFTVVFNATDTQSGFGATYASWSLQRQRAAAPIANDTCNGLTWANDGAAVVGSTSSNGKTSAQTLVNNYCYRWILNATDSVSNVATAVTSGYLLIDTTRPTGSITINNGDAYTNTTAVTLQLEGSNQGSGTSHMCLVNGTSATGCSAWETFATSKNWTLPAGDGNKSVSVLFRDGAGNVSLSYTDAIILDTTAPTTSMSVAGTSGNTYGGVSWYISNSEVSLSATDALSGIDYIDYTLNSDPGQIVGASGEINLSDGIYAITYRAVDGAGNVENFKGPSTIGIDNTAPESALDPIDEGCIGTTGSVPYMLVGLTDFDGSSTDSARNTFFRSEWWDGASGAPAAPGTAAEFALPAGSDEVDGEGNYINPILSLLPSPGSGTRVMHVRIYDAAGNSDIDQTMTVVVDGDAPAGTFTIVPAEVDGALDGYTNNPLVTLDLSGILDVGCSELSQIKVSYDANASWSDIIAVDGASAQITLPYVADGSADGPVTVSLIAYDALGNGTAYGDIPDQNIFLDTLTPEAEAEINYGDEYTAGSHIMVNPAATDPGEPDTGSGAYQVQFSNDGEIWGVLRDDEFVIDAWADYEEGDSLPWTLLEAEVGPGETEELTMFMRYRDRAGNVSSINDGSINLAGAMQPQFEIAARVYANCDGSNQAFNLTGSLTWASGQRLCLMPTLVMSNEGRDYVYVPEPSEPSDPEDSAYEDAVLAKDPLAYYRLGEDSGSTAADSSGNGRDGSYFGNYTQGLAGLLGDDEDTSLGFNGTGGHVSIPSLFLTQHSVAAWYQKDVSTGTYHQISMYAMGSHGHLYVHSDGYVLYQGLNNATGTTHNYFAGGTSSYRPFANDGSMHFIVATYDGTTMRTYIDGVEQGPGSVVNLRSTPPPIGPASLIGRSTAYHPNGIMDEVAFFDRALTPAEIADLYTVGSTVGTGGDDGSATPCTPETASNSACRQIRGYIETESVTVNGQAVNIADPASITVDISTNPNQSSVTNCEGIVSWNHPGGANGYDWRQFCFSQATSAEGEQLFVAIPFTITGTVHWEFVNPQPDDPIIAVNDIPFTITDTLTVDVRNLGQTD